MWLTTLLAVVFGISSASAPVISNTGCGCVSECGTSLFTSSKWCWVDSDHCDIDGCDCKLWMNTWDYCFEPGRYVGRAYHLREIHRLRRKLKRLLPNDPELARQLPASPRWRLSMASFTIILCCSGVFLMSNATIVVRLPRPRRRVPAARAGPASDALAGAGAAVVQVTPLQEALVRNISAMCNEVPAEFRCPITMAVMKDPVVAADGHTYERSAIESWLRQRKVSPLTNSPMTAKPLTPNLAMRSQIESLGHVLKDVVE